MAGPGPSTSVREPPAATSLSTVLELVATTEAGTSDPAPTATTGSGTSSSEPATFEANRDVGGGGTTFEDSARFRAYGAESSAAKETLSMLEGAYDCFVGKLGFRSSGLSYNGDDGSCFKTNFYSVASLDGGAAGLQHSDMQTGFGYVEVLEQYLTNPQITVHEYGHVVHFHHALIGDSHQVIVDATTDSGNYYQAWPFFTYLTSNPDDFAGLGQDTLRQMMLQYTAESNETPLHTLAHVSENATVRDIVGRYWAHMAYADIGHPTAKETFLSQRDSINFDNLEASGSGYKVKTDRQPRYVGSNIIPLTASGGTIEVKVDADAAFTGTLAIHNTSSGEVRYVALVDGAASASVDDGEEASLVIANTPDELIDYEGFELSEDVQKGLDYSVTISGATA
ncbi:hypothetical protein ACJ41O_006785 [Fusarium nematophilum]